MDVIVTLEHRFEQQPDGTVWTSSQFPYAFWTRYLEVFDGVRVLARVAPAGEATLGRRADGNGVTFIPVPAYVGPWQFLLTYPGVVRAIRRAPRHDSAVIMRVPGNMGNLLHPALIRDGHPYGAEVVSDPQDVFAPGAYRHPLRPFLRWWAVRRLRRQCVHATAVAYVTAEALQRRYPPGPDTHATHYSSVELDDAAFVAAPRTVSAATRPLRIVTVGSLWHHHKGVDVLIKAVGAGIRQGLDLRLTVVGDGARRADFEALRDRLGLQAQVHFTGQLPSAEHVRDVLDRHHLFVLPSRHEGLPRAMIEAMARGLPCLGSTVGGIPELLAPDEMVPPDDVAALAAKLADVVGDPDRMNRMAQRHLERARDYHRDILQQRRNTFYRHIAAETAAWQHRRRATVPVEERTW